MHTHTTVQSQSSLPKVLLLNTCLHPTHLSHCMQARGVQQLFPTPLFSSRRFYQHLPQGCEWAFGLVWGHSVSSDLIHWQHLPHAVVPTAGSLDADGCFSGCATIDTDGTPILLYTGVRLRTNPDAQPPPPPECDLHLPFIESQLYAVPRDPGEIGWGFGSSCQGFAGVACEGFCQGLC